MCQDCEDNFFQDDNDGEENFLEQIPEAERESFFTFACEQFRFMIDQASTHGILTPLITEWSRERQAAFTLACVMESRAQSFKTDVIDDTPEDSPENWG